MCNIVKSSLSCFRQNLPYIVLGSITITAVVIGILAILKTTPFASFPYTDDLTGIAFTVAAFAILSCLVCGSYRRNTSLNIQGSVTQIKDNKSSDLDFIKRELGIDRLHDSIRRCEAVSLEEHEIDSEETIQSIKLSNQGSGYIKCKNGSVLVLRCSKVMDLEMVPYTLAFCRQEDTLKIVQYEGDKVAKYESAAVKKFADSSFSVRFTELLTKGTCTQEETIYNLIGK